MKKTEPAMKKIVSTLIFLCMASMDTYTQSPHMIVCTFEKYPTNLTTQSENKKMPAHTARYIRGIYGSYFGYLSDSNTAGQLIFPRKHNDCSFKLVIAEKIEPLFMLENTINTWVIPEKISYAYYDIERKKDEKTNLYFWEVKKEELPHDRALPLNVITLIAKPEELYIPTGITVTTNTAQITLPTIFVKSTIHLANNALSIVPIRQFFESLSRSSKTQGADVQSKLARNTS
jgi:hypothetical protein